MAVKESDSNIVSIESPKPITFKTTDTVRIALKEIGKKEGLTVNETLFRLVMLYQNPNNEDRDKLFDFLFEYEERQKKKKQVQDYLEGK